MTDITAIILTYNEEKHLERCILSIKNLVKKIIIVDSFSSDKTINIAKKYNAEILQNLFINQSKQINWGLDNIKFSTEWILRIDADEFFTDKLEEQIRIKLKVDNQNFNGITLNRKVRFFNKDINFGGVSPHKTLRIWKVGSGYCEDAWMDEQIIVKGEILHINESLIDHNLNNLSWWIKKHKSYAIREAINYLLIKDNFESSKASVLDPAKLNKYYKLKIYYRLPKFIRPLLLFLYNYFIRLGILCGWQGLFFYLLQTLWFRFLVDVNINRIKKMIKIQKITLTEAITRKFGYKKI